MKVIFRFIIFAFACSSLKAQTVLFQKTYGSTGDDRFYSIAQCSDGNFFLAGQISGIGAGGKDVYLVKINPNGDTIWTKTYGGSGDEYANSIVATNDSGWVLVGTTTSFGNGDNDMYVLKLNSLGNVLWSKTIGGTTGYEEAKSVNIDIYGNIIVSGYTSSFGAGSSDGYVAKLSPVGNLIWTKTFGKNNGDDIYNGLIADTSSILICGGYTGIGNSYGATMLIKMNNNGDTIWTRLYTLGGNEAGLYVIKTLDNGYLISSTSQTTGPVRIFLVKTDSLGIVQWNKTYTAPLVNNDTRAHSVIQLADSSYVLTGFYLTNNQLNSEVFSLKINPIGDTLWTRAYGGNSLDWAFGIIQTIDGFLIEGLSISFSGGFDCYLIKTDSNGNSLCNQKGRNIVVNAENVSYPNDSIFISSGGTINNAATIIGSGGTVNTICTNVGFQEYQNEDFVISLYPNPSNGIFTITTSSNSHLQSSITIYNTLGELISPLSFTRGVGGEVEINLSTQPKGIYFLIIRAEGKSYSQKLIIQ